MHTKKEFEKCYTKQENGCWLWIKGTIVGYGCCRWIDRSRLAHHISFLLYENKVVPRGMLLRHMCHTPLCVNPAHLKLGTHADNMQDEFDKGRTSFGMEPYNSDESMLQCFLMRRWGFTYGEIANATGRSEAHFRMIEKGKIRKGLRSMFIEALKSQEEA